MRASVSYMDLHSQLREFTFADWKIYTIVGVMIDLGMITILECQADPCRRDTREFARSGRRGQGDILVLDHIHERQSGGWHEIANLRIMHLSCNSGWRRGRPGFKHSPETCAQMSASVKAAHADGKYKKIYTPERAEKIRKTRKKNAAANPMSAETRAKISAARKGKPSGMKGRKMSDETKRKLSEAQKAAHARRRLLEESEKDQ